MAGCKYLCDRKGATTRGRFFLCPILKVVNTFAIERGQQQLERIDIFVTHHGCKYLCDRKGATTLSFLPLKEGFQCCKYLCDRKGATTNLRCGKVSISRML